MPRPVAKPHDSHGVQQPDVAIAVLAERQYGLISRAQLHAIGLGRGGIEHRLRRRRLHPVEPRVYAVGHPILTVEARWMAAVLAGGEPAVLSHWSAASLWRLRSEVGPRSHVTVPSRRRSRQTIAFHFALLPDDEISEQRGIPVTAPARVILDLASHMPPAALHRTLEAAERLLPWCGPTIPQLLDRYPSRSGTRRLRAVSTAPLSMTRSELEARFLYLIDQWGLPRPQTNVTILGFEVDCVWPEHRLVVELDGFRTHGTRRAFERDRHKDRALAAAGWPVIRVTARQLRDHADAVGGDLRRLVAG